jgi:hypothetical protein
MKRIAITLGSWLVIAAMAAPFWGCGQVISISLTREGTASVVGKVELNGAKRTFQGTADAEGNISWNIEGCSGSAKVDPHSTVIVSCSDPLLMEWPSCWTLTSATWSAPELGLSGAILEAPAGAYFLDPAYGAIVTDPGFSAHVLNLDIDNIGPTRIVLDLTFAVSGCPVDGVCLKGLDVALVVPTSPPGQPPQIVPTEGLGVDFTVFSAGDVHVHCMDDATPVEGKTWGALKNLYR